MSECKASGLERRLRAKMRLPSSLVTCVPYGTHAAEENAVWLLLVVFVTLPPMCTCTQQVAKCFKRKQRHKTANLAGRVYSLSCHHWCWELSTFGGNVEPHSWVWWKNRTYAEFSLNSHQAKQEQKLKLNLTFPNAKSHGKHWSPSAHRIVELQTEHGFLAESPH